MNNFTYLCNPKRKRGSSSKWCHSSVGRANQLVEQRTENPCVPGSIPGDTTLKIRELQKCDSLILCVKELGFPKRLNKMLAV